MTQVLGTWYARAGCSLVALYSHAHCRLDDNCGECLPGHVLAELVSPHIPASMHHISGAISEAQMQTNLWHQQSNGAQDKDSEDSALNADSKRC